MNLKEFSLGLKLENKIFGITRKQEVDSVTQSTGGCSMKLFTKLERGTPVIITEENLKCTGAPNGFGFRDGMPIIPGGFGNFICQGAGKGYPTGERLKSSPEVAENMVHYQTNRVMEGFKAVEVKVLEEADSPELVTIIANCDQLSALITLHAYRSHSYETAIVPMCSGCASIFRIPFGELEKKEQRAIVGNTDIVSRPYFEKDTLFITVSGIHFLQMLEDADESFLIGPLWKKIRERA